MPPVLECQLMEPKLTMEPPPAAFIIGATAWMAKNWWRKLVAIRSSQNAGVTSCQAWRWSLAALFTSTVTGPSFRATAAIAACSAAMSVRSQCWKNGSGWPASRNDWHRAKAASSAMSTNATWAPWWAKAETSAAPMPDAPPVTNTTRPRKLG